jgi:hypothetical protein
MGSSRSGAEIKTFVDGVPMYMSVWNHPLLDLMSIDAAQSIEVFKGPQPQKFGNAFSAINLVPKKHKYFARCLVLDDRGSMPAWSANGFGNTGSRTMFFLWVRYSGWRSVIAF